jgi:hypothetical protein
MKKISFYFLLFISPLFLHAEEVINVGLVDGLWFSEGIFFEGDKTELNAVFFNNSGFDISGLIIFYNNGKEFHSESIEVSESELFYIQIPFVAKKGSQNFEAKILEVAILRENGLKERALAKNTVIDLGSKILEVDTDSDGDNIGNSIDEDDDGDGYSDKIEKKEGSDPLRESSTPKNKKIQKKDYNILENDDKIVSFLRKTSNKIVVRAEEVQKNLKNYLGEKIVKEESEKEILEEKETRLKKIESENLQIFLQSDDEEKTKILKEAISLDEEIKNIISSKKEKGYYLVFLKF